MTRRLRFPLFLLLVLAVLAILPGSAQAAAPFDRRGLGPNHTSELPGAGYLLTDPYQGGSRAYWAGAYRTIAGQRSYCIDDYYDYPDPSYGYRTVEAGAWPGRPGSNLGANGHVASQIAWIVNRYGSSASPSVDAEVSMAINLLMGSQPFNRSYTNYFRPQLDAIDHRIVPAINLMIRDSDRYAGPYRTAIRMGPPPGIGGSGSFIVLVRSARGWPVPHASIAIATSPGMVLHAKSPITTNSSGVANVRYTATRSGPLAITAAGRAMPNTTIRIGYSPTHNTTNFSTGSQRVALVSAHPFVPVRRITTHVVISSAAIHTVVDGGSRGRRVGEHVADHIVAVGLGHGAVFRLAVTLRDRSGLLCGNKVLTVRSDVHGRLDLHTASLPVCGGGTDTFSERLTLGPVSVAVSPPNQPAETFPVTPQIETAVVGGTKPRLVGTPVADQVRVTGLPSGPISVLAVLVDSTGRTCAHVSTSTTPNRQGRLDLATPKIAACGTARNTFVEQVLDRTGSVLIASKPWSPAETFTVKPPPPTSTPPASSTPPTSIPPTSTPPTTMPPTSAPSTHPSAPPSPSHPSAPPTSRPKPPAAAPPHLAMTGAGSRLALVGGLLSIGVGGLILIATRRT